jgi:hypothetical protein
VFVKDNKEQEALKKKIIDEGVKIQAEIVSFNTKPDPDDWEHTIYKIEYQFQVKDKTVKKKISISINTMHIAYAHLGQLIGLPKLDISNEDFDKSLAPGQQIDVIVLEEPPYHHLVMFNEVSSKIMGIRNMWA